VRSGSIHEIAGALYTLMATNTAMCITGLILGLKPVPEISLQECVPPTFSVVEIATDLQDGSALVILYLLSMSWIIVVASSASCNRLSDDTKILQLASVIQSYIILAFAFAVLATAPRFGTTPECSQNTFAVIFRPFSALKAGRIFGWILFGLAFICYTAMTVRDYTAQVQKRLRKNKELRGDVGEPSLPQQPPVAVFTLPKGKQRTPTEEKARTPRRKARLLSFRIIYPIFIYLCYVRKHTTDNPAGILMANCFSPSLSSSLPGLSSCLTRSYSFTGINQPSRMEGLPGSLVRCGQDSFNLQDQIDDLSPDFANVFNPPASG